MPVLYIISIISLCFLPLLYHCFLSYLKKKSLYHFPMGKHFKEHLGNAFSHVV